MTRPILMPVLVAVGLAAAPHPSAAVDGAADRVVASLGSVQVRTLVLDVLDRNPELARLAAEAAAAERRPAQVRNLPDPIASLTLFLQSPQTRVGPQRAAVNLTQKVPWFGTLSLREQTAVLEAATTRSRLEAARLAKVTRARTLAHELDFVQREAELVAEDLATLARAEEVARARYASGDGSSADVIRIQAEITRARGRHLAIADRRLSLVAQLNALRDRPGAPAVAATGAASADPELPPVARLREVALDNRPELAAARASAEAAALRVDLAETGRRPEFTLGLTYGIVGERDDDAGRRNPPEGDGDDILGVSGGVTVPLWGERNAARIEESTHRRQASEEAVRAVTAAIDAELGRLAHRIPLLLEQRELTDGILAIQAEEALSAAEAAYAAGTGSATQLLDAERVLVSVRTASARLRADLAIALAELDGALGAPWTGVAP